MPSRSYILSINIIKNDTTKLLPFIWDSPYIYLFPVKNDLEIDPIEQNMAPRSRSSSSKKTSRNVTMTIVTAALLLSLVFTFLTIMIAVQSPSLPGNGSGNCYQLPVDITTTAAAAAADKYVPASTEKFILEHTREMGYTSSKNPSGCDMWLSNEKYPELNKNLTNYAIDLEEYTRVVNNMDPANIPNLLKTIQQTGSHDVCNRIKLHPLGLKGLFPSNQLSLTGRSGYVEPLLPPFRSNKICSRLEFGFMKRPHVLDMGYLVHDFEAMCLNLKPSSKIILIDMGASLAFQRKRKSPMLQIMELYEKFGFHFDHIFAFEITEMKPQRVFNDLLPEKYLSSYHWINTGVSPSKDDKMNPLHSILKKFDEDDLIIVKLDIDTPRVELPLVHQLMDGGKNGIYHKLVDQFYFEHHIHMHEMADHWGKKVNGTIHDSLEIFITLRKMGIASHSWV